MKISRPSPSMVVAGIALFVSLGGTSMAAVNYASRRGVGRRQERRHSSARTRGPPAARRDSRSGTDKGRMPGKFVSDVRRPNVQRRFEVADNAPGAPQTSATSAASAR